MCCHFKPARRYLIAGALAAAFLPTQAQDLKGPIRIIVGYPPGGTADAVARLYAEELQQRLNVQVIVENKAGAGGQIAAETFRTSAQPDGSTLLLANSHMMSTLPLTTRSVKYDSVKDFEPISQLATFEVGLIASSGNPARGVREYVDAVRANPKLGFYGIPAPGSSPQFVGYSIGRRETLSLTAVPYKGGAPLVSDLLGGQVPVGIDAVGGSLELVKAGKLRVLAVVGPKRLPWLPEVPTFAEPGYNDLDRSSWMGLFAPLQTPPALIRRINQAVVAASASPRMAEQLEKFAILPASSSPEDLRESVRQELSTWGPIVKASGYQAD